MPDPNLRGHSYGDPTAAKGKASPKDSYKPGWTQEGPSGGRVKTNYKERKRSGTAVPIPPELPNPQGR